MVYIINLYVFVLSPKYKIHFKILTLPALVTSARFSVASQFNNMDENSQKSLFYCSLLALQFGLQPILASKFTASGVSKTSIVIATEITKIFIAMISLLSGPKAELERIRKTWTLSESLKVAALPATLYAIQNLLVQYGYIFLDSMTFNLLNQTKVLLVSCSSNNLVLL